jgi:truncated hemoglobin YjbI
MNRFVSRSIPALFAMAMFASVGLADEGSVATSDLDSRIDKALLETINIGVPVYNRGDAAGCYWLYRGSLGTITPFLAHRPELQSSVMKGIATADTMGRYDQRATALRAVLDDVRAKVTTAAPKPLWTRLGGEPAVKAVIHDFVQKAASDPKVDFTRGGKFPIDAAGVAHLEELLVQLVSAVTGGPLKYTGRDMKSSHAGMGITDAQFTALAVDLIEVLQSYNVQKKEIDELVGIIATTKKDIVEAPKPVDPNSLWVRLGGEPAVKAVVHDFVGKAANDPKVDFTRGGKYPLDAAGVVHLEELLVQLISAVTGGPLKYTGRDMKSSHAGMAITDTQFGALATDLIEVLQSYNVKKKEIDELVGIIATTKKDIVEAPK